MEKELIKKARFKGVVKHEVYLINKDFEIVHRSTGAEAIVPKDYITRQNSGMIYSTSDGPFSAKGFYVLDSEVSEGDGALVAEYIFNVDLKPEQFDKYRTLIIDPIIAKFWQETKQATQATDSMLQKAIDKAKS